MKSANDTITGKIVDYDEKTGELIIRAKYDDIGILTKRQYDKCSVRLIDSRKLSSKQRNTCYMLLREIADFAGMSEDRTKNIMKIKFTTEIFQDTAEDLFSLSDAPMSLVCEFQRFLVRFIIDYDIPCSFKLYDFVDDIGDYLYACIMAKKCVICGTHADLHHIDRVGMGGNRDEIVHLGMEALPLCREHHAEAHSIGLTEWKDRYHIEKGIIIDEAIARVYRLNTKNRREKKNAQQSLPDGPHGA